MASAANKIARRSTRQVIGIDFGSTLGAVAYVVLQPGQNPDLVTESHVSMINDYPDDTLPQHTLSEEVPVLLAYEQTPNNPKWGFEVTAMLEFPSNPIHKTPDHFIARPKLLLDDSNITEGIRAGLHEKMFSLIAQGLINTSEDIITDYLTPWMACVRASLIGMGKVNMTDEPEFTICVPTIWDSDKQHELCKAMENAIRAAWPVFTDSSSPIDLFTVREPEAAGAALLSAVSSDIYAGQIILIVDAGGSTVEMTAYRIISKAPLRFEEVTQTSARVCGSDLSNHSFKALVLRLLKDAKYLENPRKGITISGLIDARIMPCFENRTKRKLDFDIPFRCQDSYYLEGLRADPYNRDPEKRFKEDILEINRNQLLGVFLPLLREVEKLLEEQFDQAEAANVKISYVLLAGGFSDAVALRTCIEKWLRGHGKSAELAPPTRIAGVAVAKGAVLRSLNKEHGPSRFIRSSVAIVRKIPVYKTKKETRKNIPELLDCFHLKEKFLDDEYYIDQCLEWFIHLGDPFEPGQKFVFMSRHLFKASEQHWIGYEGLFHCSKLMQHLKPRSHVMNRGAKAFGEIMIDMSPLRERGRIEAQNIGTRGKFYEVVLRVVIQLLVGHPHTLKCHGEWAPDMKSDDDVKATARGVGPNELVTTKDGLFNIVAHFTPGTKGTA